MTPTPPSPGSSPDHSSQPPASAPALGAGPRSNPSPPPLPASTPSVPVTPTPKSAQGSVSPAGGASAKLASYGGGAPTKSGPDSAATSKSGARRAGTKVVRTFTEKLEIVMTSLPTLWGTGLLSLGLIVWVLVTQLPRTFETRLVSARTHLDETYKAAEEASQHEAVDQTVLSNQVFRAQRFLIADKDQLIAIASEIEKMAKANGLQAEMSSVPNSDRAPVAPQVVVRSSSLRLQPLVPKTRTNSVSQPLYSRLLPFLDRLDQLTNKVEISSLSVATDRNGASVAQMELQFWVRKTDEKDSGK